MAVKATGHNITRQEDFEGSPGGTVGGTGGGPAASAAVGIAYEGASAAASQALSRRIAATGGHGFDYAHGDIGTVNMYNAGFHVWLAKIYTTITALAAPGVEAGIGDADGSMYRAQIGDDGTMGDDADFEYPPAGGYLIYPWEARVNAWHTVGREATPDISVADTVEAIFDVAVTLGAGLSSAMDSIDYTTDGLYGWGGDSTDPDLTFADFVLADEGRGLSGAGRAGIWRSSPAGFVFFLTNVIGRTDGGTVTATEFTDSGFSLTCPGGLVSEGRNGLEFDISHASTVVTLSDGSISGSAARFGGRTKITRYFDTEIDVNATTDRITIVDHGFRTGDAVVYSAEGGTEDIGPDATTGEAEFNTAGAVGTGAYWYVIKFDDDEFQLAATPFAAYAVSPTAAALTASTAGNGERHSLTRAPDTRPNILFTVDGTDGTASFTRVSQILTRIITLQSPVTYTSCVISQGRQLILNDATLANCIIAAPTTSIGEAYLQAIHANDLNEIDGTSFTSGGLGHAIEVTTDGTAAQDTGTLTDVNFSGYFDDDEDLTGGWSFNASTDVSSNQITMTGHGWTTGDPVYYSDEGGTQIVGLVDQDLYFVEVIDANTVEMHFTPTSAAGGTNPISLTAGSSETHKLYSGNAAFLNGTGTALTINVSGGSIPTIRNTAGSTTTVVSSTQVTFTGLKDNSEVRVYDSGTGVEIAGIEDATAGSPDNRTFAWNDTATNVVDYVIHNYQPGVVVYETIRVNGFVVPGVNTSIPIQQRIDRNVPIE
jgi:hypothetical protein